ncbi:MAG: elongation factor P [Acidiferrobacteraceae bacterium]|nr:elongation factor P [Acidiferrobacteraceae bacterium]|tara:strand:+ start:630 stop:1193 length:564 start_codon:yes stop_codon:yes gene_type:complete
MKISASDVRIGNLLAYQGKLYRVLKKDHVKPGKGGAFVQLELKENGGGSKLNERFRSEDKVEKARVEPRQMEYLYPDGTDYVFMDLESYEQIHLNAETIDIKSDYLLPNQEVQINFYNDQPINIEVASVVTLAVSETETSVKGQTASGSGKPATLETGLRVIVPTFVQPGDKIRVNTETNEYIERAD